MRQPNRSGRGSAIVEFAVTSSLLMTFFAGVWQFGYTFYIYNQLQSAVRGAARYGSLTAYDGGSSAGAAFEERVKNMVVYGKPDPGEGDQPLVAGLTTSHVRVSETFEGATPSRIEVDIVDYRIDAFFTRFALNGKPRCAFPYMGRFIAPA